MTFPAIVFSFFISAMLGSLLHIWRGGSLFRLVLYLVLSWVGFFGGHLIAEALQINLIDVGTIHLGMGLVGSLTLLGVGYWLSLVDVENS
jgi:hypothetical protein